MKSEQINVETLISQLSEARTPVRPLAHPFMRMIPWLVLVPVYLAAVTAYLGVRQDIFGKTADLVFVFEYMLILALALFSSTASLWSTIPDMRGQKWLVAASFTLLGVAFVWYGLRIVTEPTAMPHMHLHHCISEALFLGAIPAFYLVFLSFRGASTMPITTMALALVGASSVGYLGIRLTCANDNMGHGFFYHILPYIGAGALAAVFLRRFYRW